MFGAGFRKIGQAKVAFNRVESPDILLDVGGDEKISVRVLNARRIRDMLKV